MRSSATKLASGAVVGLLAGAPSLGATRCDCPTPPGGTGSCEDDQVACCRVKLDDCEVICATPPTGSRYGSDLLNWVLATASDGTTSLKELGSTVDGERVARFLESGRDGKQYDFESSAGGAHIGLPASLRVELEELQKAESWRPVGQPEPMIQREPVEPPKPMNQLEPVEPQGGRR